MDEERRQVQEHMRTRGQTVFQYGAFLRTAPVIERFRHSSSVTKIGSEAPILATASPRGKPRALPRQCDKHQFIALVQAGMGRVANSDLYNLYKIPIENKRNL